MNTQTHNQTNTFRLNYICMLNISRSRSLSPVPESSSSVVPISASAPDIPIFGTPLSSTPSSDSAGCCSSSLMLTVAAVGAARSTGKKNPAPLGSAMESHRNNTQLIQTDRRVQTCHRISHLFGCPPTYSARCDRPSPACGSVRLSQLPESEWLSAARDPRCCW